MIAALVAVFVSLQAVPALADDGQRKGRGRDRDRYEDVRARPAPAGWRTYDERRVEPRQARYDAARYYRRGDRPVRLGRNDRIYRGSDDRYYCRRDDGTTGLIVGGVAGAVLGNIIAPDGWKTVGTIIGGGAGAVLGKEVDEVECR